MNHELLITPHGSNGSTRLSVVVADTNTGAQSEPVSVTRETMSDGANRLAALMEGTNPADVAQALANAMDGREQHDEPSIIDAPPRKHVPPFVQFPVNALPAVMEQFANGVAASLCVDPVMPVGMMLSVAGAAIGNTARARMSADYLAPPNIWSGTMQRSGERKSPVTRAVMNPIYAQQHEAAERYTQQVADYKNELERWKAKPKGERGDSPVEPGAYPHLYLSDTTTEAIAMRLQAQPRGLPLVLDELAALFNGLNQYKKGGGNDRESYLSFYDAGPAKIDRRTSTPPTIFIPRAFVSVAGMIQPGALARALGPAEFDTGFAARFLFAAPPPMRATWTAHGMTECARDGWRTLIYSLLEMPLPEEPIQVPPSDVAMRLWAATHDRMDDERHAEPDDRIRAARAKLIGAIPRLALILQCVSSASGEQQASVRCIDELSMRRAIEIVEWYTHETRRVYGMLTDDGEGECDLLARIEENGGAVSVRELMRWSREFRTASIAQSYLDSLATDGVGRWGWARQTGRGQPRRVFILLRRADADSNGDGAIKNGNCVSVSAAK